MKIKQRPEDFSVKESYRFDQVADGPFRVYLMDKQKLSTFDAINRLQEKFGLKPGSISYCGLKDKQGRTEQLIAVKGFEVDMQEPDLRLKYLGRTNKALSAANTTSNRFAVTVRQIDDKDLNLVTLAAVEVNRLGVVNYFDSQRFGSLKHGQGFIAKDLIRGDFEAALHNYLAKPSPLDRSDDAKVKGFWQANWGNWDERCPYDAGKKYFRVIRCLRNDPTDFVNAFLQIDSDYRALLLFTYQSYLWNESARRLMQLVLPREALFPMPYQAGTLLHHRDAGQDVLSYLRRTTVPLLAPDTTFKDAKVEEAVKWVLGKEKLTLDQLRIEENPRFLYFKHEERPLLVNPDKLVVGKARPDEMNRGFTKVNIAFTLPPGSYATLVVKRLFHFGVEKEKMEDVAPEAVMREPKVRRDHKTGKRLERPVERPEPKAEPRPPERKPEIVVGGVQARKAAHKDRDWEPTLKSDRRPDKAAPVVAPVAKTVEKQGFLARQKQKKRERAENIKKSK